MCGAGNGGIFYMKEAGKEITFTRLYQKREL